MTGTTLILFILVLFLSIDVHEFSHAWVATALGDKTAKRLGRLTLNPIAHLDPFGTVMILLASLSGFGIGWGKPVPVNPYNMQLTPSVGMGLVAAAGPASNLIMAVMGGLLLKVVQPVEALALFLVIFVIVNIGLALFNLIPVFPLDGYRILIGVLGAAKTNWTRNLASLWVKQEQWGPLMLLGIVLVNAYVPLLSWIIGPPTRFLQNIIFNL